MPSEEWVIGFVREAEVEPSGQGVAPHVQPQRGTVLLLKARRQFASRAG